MSQKRFARLWPQQRADLQKMTRSGVAKVRELTRARILLWAQRSQGRGETHAQIAQALCAPPVSVWRLCRRFVREGGHSARAIPRKPRPGQTPKVTGQVRADLLMRACPAPPQGKERWALRPLADEPARLGVAEGLGHVAVHQAPEKAESERGR